MILKSGNPAYDCHWTWYMLPSQWSWILCLPLKAVLLRRTMSPSPNWVHLYDHSFTYVSCFLFLWHTGQFCMPTSAFHPIFSKLSTCSGIHVCILGTKVQIDWKLGCLAIHQIIWTKPCSGTSSAIVPMYSPWCHVSPSGFFYLVASYPAYLLMYDWTIHIACL